MLRRWLPLVFPVLLASACAADVASSAPTASEILAPIRAAGGYDAVAARLAPWRAAVQARIDAVPPARRGGGYVADDAPIDGGDGWILSGRRARQLIYESAPVGSDPQGDRRYARAEAALLRAHRELEAMGMRFLVVPVPDKCDIYADRIAPVPDGVPTVHLRSKQLFLRLMEAGVTVVDLEPALRAARGGDRPPLYMQRDTHWSPAGARVGAEIVGTVLAAHRRPDSDAIHRTPGRVLIWDGDLAENWRRAGHEGYPRERHTFDSVARRGGGPVQPDAHSPVLVLGDSYSVFPYNGHFAFWAELSYALGFPVAFADRAGGGNTVMQRYARMPEPTRSHHKVLVLLFTSCSFYEVDFPDIPLRKTALPVASRPAYVRLEQQPPRIDPQRAQYDHALAALRAQVHYGDLVWQPVVLHLPVMRARRLTQAAAWQAGELRQLVLLPEPLDGDEGIMVIGAADVDPALPVAFADDRAWRDDF